MIASGAASVIVREVFCAKRSEDHVDPGLASNVDAVSRGVKAASYDGHAAGEPLRGEGRSANLCRVTDSRRPPYIQHFDGSIRGGRSVLPQSNVLDRIGGLDMTFVRVDHQTRLQFVARRGCRFRFRSMASDRAGGFLVVCATGGAGLAVVGRFRNEWSKAVTADVRLRAATFRQRRCAADGD